MLQQQSDEECLRKTRLLRRYEAPTILISHGIPCAVWAEDALSHYGVPTVVFDLFLLVDDPEVAVECLRNAGYIRTPQNPRFANIPQLSEGLPRLIRLPAGGINAADGSA